MQGEIIKEIPVVINVKSENFLFDASISLPSALRIVNAGDLLRAQVNLLQVGTKEKVDVVASYVIKDFAGEIYLEDSETFAVENEKSFVKEFPTEGLPPGKYVLGMEIVYPGAFATSSSVFEVEEKAGFGGFGLTKTNITLLVAVAIIIVLIILVIVIRRSMRKKKR